MERQDFKHKMHTDLTLKKIAHSLTGDILTIASKKLKMEPRNMLVLDVGSGYGLYAEEFSKKVKRVVAVEPNKKAYDAACRKTKKNLAFYNCKVEDFVTHDRFDLVLSLTTLEHMPDADASFTRIFALLKKHGIIYLTAPNKLWPFENHYKLPFLSYLSLPIANRYLRITRKGDSYEDCSYSKTYFGVQKLLRKFPCTYMFQIPDPSSPYLGMGTSNYIYHAIKNFGISLIKLFPIFWIFSKGFIIIIQKK